MYRDASTARPDATETPAPPPVPAPPVEPAIAGWASAATAIHAVRRMPVPVLLRIDVVGTGSLLIDPRTTTYGGGLPVDALPREPAAVHIETRPVDAGTAGFDTPTGDLDALLWSIGERSFGDRPASWLWANDRYRLVRWPGITQIRIGLDDIRIFAALAATHLAVPELAAAANVELGQAQRVVNALSLMGYLETSSSAPPPTPRSPATAEETAARGLFGRLRRRLGI